MNLAILNIYKTKIKNLKTNERIKGIWYSNFMRKIYRDNIFIDVEYLSVKKDFLRVKYGFVIKMKRSLE